MRNYSHLSIGILAWNEETAIEDALESLFQQSLFENLAARNITAEIICIANACTDRTAEVVDACFQRQQSNHKFNHTFTTLTVSIQERGKTNAWNLFVHRLSGKRTAFLFLMDADILITGPDTLWNMYKTLQNHPEASVSVDQPIKDIALKEDQNLFTRISLATSKMTQAGGAQLTGQLYCIRSSIARSIFLPRDLIIEDGFIKNLVCTDFLTAPSNPARLIKTPDAAHVFEAYMSPLAILRNQKRQMIGQTILHLLVDKELKHVATYSTPDFSAYLKEREQKDPDWLKKLIGEHISKLNFFWQIFPGVLSFRFSRLGALSPLARLRALPAVFIGFLVTLISSWQAYHFLRRGYTTYWPDTRNLALKKLPQTKTSQAI